MNGRTNRSFSAPLGVAQGSSSGADQHAPEVEAFWRHGYRIVPQVLDVALVASVRQVLEAHMQRQVAAAAGEMGGHSVAQFVCEPTSGTTSGARALDALSKDTRDTLSGHFSLEARLDRGLWAIPRQPRLRGILQAALRSRDLYMHMPPTARFVLPGNLHAAVPAHQDLSYNRHLTDFITVWVPLVPIDAACGGVAVYEGSGGAPEAPTDPQRDRFWLKGIPVEGYRPVHCEMAVGDVLLLNRRIIHASMPNRSDRTRLSIDFRFFGARDRSHKHHLDMQTWTVIAPPEAV